MSFLQGMKMRMSGSLHCKLECLHTNGVVIVLFILKNGHYLIIFYQPKMLRFL